MFVKGEIGVMHTFKGNLFLEAENGCRIVTFTSTFQEFAKILSNGSKLVVPISKHGVRHQHRVGTRSGQISKFDRVLNELLAFKAIFVIAPERGNYVLFGRRIK